MANLIALNLDTPRVSGFISYNTLAAALETRLTTMWRWSKNSRSDPGDNTEHCQSWRMLAAFETKHAFTTIEVRRELHIMMPARVFELRAMGHDIATVQTQGMTEYGCKHRIARYVFRKPRHERHWLERWQTLFARFSRLGIKMCIVLSQLWGLYRYLSRLADG